MSKLVHHFSVQIAKYAFWSAQRGEAVSNMPIRAVDARRLGYEPYLLFGLSIEGLPIRRLHFVRFDAPQNPADFLFMAWREMKAFLGLPDRLKVHGLVDKAWPTLGPFIRELGVEYEVAEGSDKSFIIGLRYHQEEAGMLGSCLDMNSTPDGSRLNDIVRRNDGFDLKQLEFYVVRPQDRSVFARLTERKARPVPEDLVAPAMNAASPALFDVGQSNIAHVPAVCVNRARNITFLLDRDFEDEGLPLLVADEEVLQQSASKDDFFELRDCLKPLIECWPGGINEVAGIIRMSRRRLEAFLTGRGELTQDEMEGLLYFFQAERDDEGHFEALGSYFLQAKKVVNVTASYNALSHGGDLQFGAEILPLCAAEDQSWRYVIVWPYEGRASVFMFPRGNKVTTLLEAGARRLVNLGEPAAVDNALYQAVVRAAARIGQTSRAYGHIMTELNERIERTLGDA